MSRDNLFWGLLLLVAGAILLGNNLGYFSFDIRLLWPLVIILLGVYILIGRSLYSSKEFEAKEISVPLNGAAEANIRIEHGAGSLRISGAAKNGNVLSGRFHNAFVTSDKSGSKLNVRLKPDFNHGFVWFFPWNWDNRGHEWDFALTPDVPLTLDIDTGASHNKIDLSTVKLDKLDLDTGASSTRITLPEKGGHSRVEISSGAASMEISIPKGVAADIRVESGLADINIDQSRFPRSGKHYISPTMTLQPTRSTCAWKTGMSSVKIR